MRAEAKKAGLYKHPLTGRSYDAVEIVTVREIIERKRRLELPLSVEVLKTAPVAKGPKPQQPELPILRGIKPTMAKAEHPPAKASRRRRA